MDHKCLFNAMQKRVIERIIISCYYGPGTMKRIQNSQDIFSSPLKKNDFTKIKIYH